MQQKSTKALLYCMSIAYIINVLACKVPVSNTKTETAETVETTTSAISCSSSRVSLKVGETADVTVKCADAKTALSKWTASIAGVGKIEEVPDKPYTYRITALHKGETVFSIALADDPQIRTQVTVLVTELTAANSITLNKTVIELVYEESFTLTATVLPKDFSQEVVWSVNNTDIITCTDKGVITAKKTAGRAVVKAVSKKDTSKFAECAVTVSPVKIQRIIPSTTDLSMEVNEEKPFSVRIEPDTARGSLQYRITGNTATVKAFHQNEEKAAYTGTIAANLQSGKSTIHFFSEANPDVSADIEVTVTRPLVQEITLENKTIFLDEKNASMPVSIKPVHAEQQLQWSSSSPVIAAIDETTGIITPLRPGITIITASAQNSQCSGKAMLTVKPVSEKQYTVTLSSPFVSFGHPAELIIKPEPEYGTATFTVTSNSTDIRISQNEGNPHRFIIEAFDQNIPAGEAVVKITPIGNTAAYEQTVKIILKPLTQGILMLTGPDNMYKDETIEFSVENLPSDTESESLIVWSVACANPLFEAEKWVTLHNGHLSINDEYKAMIPHGEKLTIRAVSQLHTAEKTITVYNNIARISAVTCDMSEYTLGNTQKPTIRITCENDDTAYKHFWITEYKDVFPSSCLEKTEYEISDTHSSISLPCKLHTSAKPKQFYVIPLDPKTNRPLKNAIKKSFLLTIWDTFKRIVLEKGNFDIINNPTDNTEYTLKEKYLKHNMPYDSFYVFVAQEPRYSKPILTTVQCKNGTTVIHSLISERGSDNRLRVSFGTQKSKVFVSEAETLVCTAGGKQVTLHFAIN